MQLSNLEMVRVHASNEHFMKNMKGNRRTNSVAELKELYGDNQSKGAKRKMQVSRSQPDLNFAHHQKEPDTEMDNPEHASDYSKEDNEI